VPHLTDPLSDDGALVRPGPPRSWRERLGDLADATGTSPTRLVTGAVVAVVLLAVGGWMLRPPAPPVEVALPFASTTEPSPTPTTAEVPATVLVHVAGAVQAPGVHEVSSGARVIDAIEAAGGLAGDADGTRINLAAPVRDGERVYVPAIGEDPPPVAVGSPEVAGEGPGTGSVSGPVDLNTADAAALDALPGVGPSTAAAILEHRAQIGRFTSVEQLLDVPGIGEAKLAALRDLVAV
jgi:competence protein ComEA